jgi:two-component system, OmpR family, response regulator ResD
MSEHLAEQRDTWWKDMTNEPNSPSQTILIIEDEQSISHLVKVYLERAGYRVLIAEDGAQGLEMFAREHPDLLVLDLMLPKVDGREIMSEIRLWSQTPVLMLTALSSDDDRIQGLDLGADDYMAKPFNPRELVSRVRAILRRVQPRPAPQSEALSYADLTIYPIQHKVEVAGHEVELTAKEFSLLLTLASAPDQVFTRETLLNRVWGFDYLGDSRTVDVHVGTLRRKVEHDPANPRFIKTIWRVGYKFDPRGCADSDGEQPK